MDADVIVIGAGYAGLSAADRLIGRGVRPLIVEARERVGGRTHTKVVHGQHWVDLGGQWIGPGQDRVYRLAQRFDRNVWPMYTDGKQILELAGKRRSYRGLIPLNVSPLTLANLFWAFFRIEWQARRIPVDAPWSSRHAHWFDQRTVGDWLRSNVPHRHARSIMQVAFEAVFAAHPDDIGLLHALFYIKSAGSFERLTSSAGGAQQDRVDGGMQGLAEAWKTWIEEQQVEVLFDLPVHAVSQDSSGVEVLTEHGALRAKHAIVAIPPGLASQIEFHPAMPSLRLQWCQAMVPGKVIKCFGFYDSPFWRAQGLSGQAVSDQPPVHVAFDATPPGSDSGILLGFIEGRAALEWSERGTEQRCDAVIDAFTRFFGLKAAQPTGYFDHDWTQEQWSRGCYAGVPGPGVTTSVASSARQPHGRIYWAGTETATQWNGYIEGAIQSGIRAANEIDLNG